MHPVISHINYATLLIAIGTTHNLDWLLRSNTYPILLPSRALLAADSRYLGTTRISCSILYVVLCGKSIRGLKTILVFSNVIGFCFIHYIRR